MNALPDQLITLQQLVRRLPGTRGAPRINPATAHRWVLNGIARPDGTRVRLRAIRIGRTWATTETWAAEFFEALSAAHGAPADLPRSPERRARASQKAAAELSAAGW